MASELLPKVKSLTKLGPNYCGLDILVSSCAWQVNNTSGPVTMWLRRKAPVRNFSLWIGTFFFFCVYMWFEWWLNVSHSSYGI